MPICFLSACFLQSICFYTLGNLNAEYEHVILLSVLSLIFYPIFFALNEAKSEYRSPKIYYALGKVLSLIGGLVFSQAIASLLYSRSPCSTKELVFFAVVQILPVLALSLLLGKIYKSFLANHKNFLINLVLVHGLFMLLSLAWLLVALYVFPQKRITHFVFGFIHGPIYDRWIPLDLGVILVRALHFVACLVGIVCWKYSAPLSRKNKLILFATILITFFVVFRYLSSFESQSFGHRALQKILTSVFASSEIHFFAEPSILENHPKALRQLFKSSEIYVDQISKKMGLKNIPKVYIYVYKDEDQKKRLFGGGTTDVADIFTPSVHINFTQEFPHPSLKHELVHALLRNHTPFSIGAHPNMMLTEGIAVALAPEDRERSLHEAAAYLVADKNILEVEVEKIFSPWFWMESGVRAYSLAGSFVKFLLDNYDASLFLKIYEGSGWLETYGRSLQDLIHEWRGFLDQQYAFKVKGDLGLKKLMSEASVWRDHCPHYEETLLQNSETAFISWRRPCDWERGKYWEWRLEQNQDDFSARIQIQKSLLKKSILKNQDILFDSLQDFSNYWNQNTSATSKEWSNEKVELELWKADISVFQENFSDALSLLSNIREKTRDLKLPQYLERSILVREKIFKLQDLGYIRKWTLYLNALSDLPEFEFQKDPYAITLYLYLRRKPQDFDLYFKTESLSVYEKKFVGNPLLAKELLWIVARHKILEEKFTEAENLLSHVSKQTTSGRQIYIEEILNLVREMKIRF